MRVPRRVALGAAVAVLALGATACLPPPPSHPTVGAPTVADDAYAYPGVKDGVGDFVYNQLWYFNFLDDRGDADPANDVLGVGAYGLANPDGLALQKGLTNAFGMIIRDPSEGASFNLFAPNVDPAVPGNFSASTTFAPGPGPELANPYGTIDVVSKDEYHVEGSVTQGPKTITWDLTYSRSSLDLGNGWLPWVHWPMPPTLGLVPGWIDYYMQMPNAWVDGTFVVDEGAGPVTYTLDHVKGYHDGFHSETVFSLFEWDWLDYKQADLSVHLLHPHKPQYVCVGSGQVVNPCAPGNLRVFHDGAEYSFYRGQVDITYDATTHDPVYGVDYPTQETITATDVAGNHLDLHWTLVRQLPVFYDVPAPFNDTVTYEIFATFSGTWTPAGGPAVPISGTGWCDWSGASYPGA